MSLSGVQKKCIMYRNKTRVNKTGFYKKSKLLVRLCVAMVDKEWKFHVFINFKEKQEALKC